jgi:hypothetical protein
MIGAIKVAADKEVATTEPDGMPRVLASRYVGSAWRLTDLAGAGGLALFSERRQAARDRLVGPLSR